MAPSVPTNGPESRNVIAHFVSAISLSKSSPSRTLTPKPAAGLPTEVVNDKGRYRQHRAIAIFQTSQATTVLKSFALAAVLRE